MKEYKCVFTLITQSTISHTRILFLICFSFDEHNTFIPRFSLLSTPSRWRSCLRCDRRLLKSHPKPELSAKFPFHRCLVIICTISLTFLSFPMMIIIDVWNYLASLEFDWMILGFTLRFLNNTLIIQDSLFQILSLVLPSK